MVNSGELIEAWRSDVLDDVGPYLWSRAEAIRYAEAAYRRFVRLTGGIHDFTSPLTRVDIVAGEEIATVSPLILRFDKAQRESDGREIAIANWTDQGLMRRDDYGVSSFLYNDRAPGEVRYMVIGSEVGKVKWVSPPAADDVALLQVYRLPLTRIVDETHTLSEVNEDYHIHLLDWMKHLAYLKRDSETYNKRASDEHRAAFIQTCAEAKAEMDRYRSKVRTVQYGGL